MSEKQIPVLSNWSIGFDYRLQGNVTGRAGFNDGDYITTSRIIGQTVEGRVRTKSGTEYVLNDVDPGYEELFPGARERVFNVLPFLLADSTPEGLPHDQPFEQT